jgi:hypothetical protein
MQLMPELKLAQQRMQVVCAQVKTADAGQLQDSHLQVLR